MTPEQKQHELAAITERNHCLAIRLNDVPDTLILPSTAGQFVADIDFLLTLLADAERERDEVERQRNFLEQNETVVWDVLQIADGSTIHDVAAAVFKMRADLAAVTERAEQAADAIERGEYKEPAR